MLGENLLVLLDKPKEKTESGIYLVHDNPKSEQRTGTIVRCAEGEKVYTEGKRVMIKLNVGVPVDYKGEQHVIIQKNDAICFVDSE